MGNDVLTRLIVAGLLGLPPTVMGVLALYGARGKHIDPSLKSWWTPKNNDRSDIIVTRVGGVFCIILGLWMFRLALGS